MFDWADSKDCLPGSFKVESADKMGFQLCLRMTASGLILLMMIAIAVSDIFIGLVGFLHSHGFVCFLIQKDGPSRKIYACHDWS